MGTPVFKDISLMVFPLFLKSIIVFNFFVLGVSPTFCTKVTLR